VHANASSERQRCLGRCIRSRKLFLGCLLLAHAGLLGHSAYIHSPVIDEPAHLAAGLSHWRFSDFSLYRVNPPLVRMVAAAPLFAASMATDWNQFSPSTMERREMSVGDDLVRANGCRFFHYLTLARWTCIPFSLIGALVSYRWARLVFGKASGLAAALLWCFSPTVLGHASLITPDAAASAVGLAACYAFFRWLVGPRWRRAVLAGLALGAAESCKSTWIILFVAFPLLWLVFCFGLRSGTRRPGVRQLAAILLIGWIVLVTIYGWQGLAAR